MRLPLIKEIVEDVLNELIVHGDRNNAEYVVSYKQDLWLLPDEEVPDDVAAKILGKTAVGDLKDIYELVEDVDNLNINGVVIGQINGNELHVFKTGTLDKDPKSSVNIKKIVDQLGLSSVSYTTMDDEATVDRSEITGKIPDIAYHGTTTEYLDNILRFGLKPGEKETNYPQVQKVNPGFLDLMQNTVYFSTRFDEAMHHASYTTDRLNAKNPGGTDPVVIALKIPDKNKLITDFDVNRELHRNDKAFSTTKEVGVYGYRGRVPASFFQGFYVAMNTEPDQVHYVKKDDFTELSKDELQRYLESKEMIGYGDPDYDPSDYEDEEDYVA